MKYQLHGSIDENIATLIKSTAEEEQRSLNNFVGLLILKGWKEYIKGKEVHNEN